VRRVSRLGTSRALRMQRLAAASRVRWPLRAPGLRDMRGEKEEQPESGVAWRSLTMRRDAHGSGRAPVNLHEAVVEMLQAGFEPQKCFFLRENFPGW